MLKWWRVPLYPDWINAVNHLIGYISNSNFKFKFQMFKFKTNLCLPVFVAKRIFKTHQQFCFLCFHSRWRFFWFHKDREITKMFFYLSRKKFRRKKPFVHPLELWRNFICGNETGSLGRAISLHLARSGSQSEHRIRRILPARGASHIIIRVFPLLRHFTIFGQENAQNMRR